MLSSESADNKNNIELDEFIKTLKQSINTFLFEF